MTTNNDQLVEAFDKFKIQIDDAYTVARAQLMEGDWPGAQRTLATIAQTHARTSLSLRNVLVKRGLIVGEE